MEAKCTEVLVVKIDAACDDATKKELILSAGGTEEEGLHFVVVDVDDDEATENKEFMKTRVNRDFCG